MAKEITASVTERGQVTIPAEIRKELDLQPGDKVIFRTENGHITIKRPAFTLRSLAGSVTPLTSALTWDEMTRIAQEDAAEQSAHTTEP